MEDNAVCQGSNSASIQLCGIESAFVLARNARLEKIAETRRVSALE
jgi:hypothetical protein